MIPRLKYWIFGHKWEWQETRILPGCGYGGTPTCENHRLALYGFTEKHWSCKCGAHRTRRTVGAVPPKPPVDTETEALRKMAGL